MESIGEKLRGTRNEKGYTIEQVARDTHIAKRFIEALEAEDFDVFPGEPYLLGFLRTYAEFLDLDPQEMVSLYKNLKIQEQPAPIDELIVKKSPRPYVIAGLAVLVVVGLGLGGFFLVRSGVIGGGSSSDGNRSSAAVETTTAEDGQADSREFVLQEQILERRFAEGDVVQVPVGEDLYPVSLGDVRAGGVRVTTSSGEMVLEPESERMLDVDDDGQGDIRVLVRQIDAAGSPPSLVMRLDRVVQSPVARAEGGPPEAEPSDTAPIGETNIPERERSARVIAEFAEQDEFSVEIEFRGYSWFRYVADGEQREEQYLQQGDTFRTTVQESFRLWISNAGVAALRVAGQEVDLGDPGEVAAVLFTWADTGSDEAARLELVPVY